MRFYLHYKHVLVASCYCHILLFLTLVCCKNWWTGSEK